MSSAIGRAYSSQRMDGELTDDPTVLAYWAGLKNDTKATRYRTSQRRPASLSADEASEAIKPAHAMVVRRAIPGTTAGHPEAESTPAKVRETPEASQTAVAFWPTTWAGAPSFPFGKSRPAARPQNSLFSCSPGAAGSLITPIMTPQDPARGHPCLLWGTDWFPWCTSPTLAQMLGSSLEAPANDSIDAVRSL